MDNIRFLKEVLMSEEEYWIVARKNYASQYGEMKQTSDDVLIITIPYEIRRGLAPENILLSDAEKLQSIELPNIFVSNEYPPFQRGITMYNIYNGYPIKDNIKEFMMKALALGSKDLYDYAELLKSQQEPELLTS